MNKSILSLLLIFISIASSSLLSMQEVKAKAAEQAASRADAADHKAEVATAHEVALPDALCPAGLSADVWALITDYAVDMSSEHEAFTYSKTFLNVMHHEIMDDARVVLTPLAVLEVVPDVYSFKDKSLAKATPKPTFSSFGKKFAKTILITNKFHKHQPATEVAAYQLDGITLINKFAVQAPKHIDYYVEMPDAQIALAITDNDVYHQLVLWDPETNKIERTEKLYCLIDFIIPLSKNRLALSVRNQKRIIIKDLTAQKDGELDLTKKISAWDKLFEFDNGNILTLCDGVLNVWCGATYKKLITISECQSLERVPGKVVIMRYDCTIDSLDENTLLQEQLMGASTSNGTIKFDGDNALLLTSGLTKQCVYQLYPVDSRIDGPLLTAYLSLRMSQQGEQRFCGGHAFHVLEAHHIVRNPDWFKLPEYAIQIIWYDQEAVLASRKLSLETKEKLKLFLQGLRDRKAKLIDAGSAEPFKFDDAEVVFLNSLPARIQENIKSHYLDAPVHIKI